MSKTAKPHSSIHFLHSFLCVAEKTRKFFLLKVKRSVLYDIFFAGHFIKVFHRKHWLDSTDCELVSVCLLAKISAIKTRSDAIANSIQISPQDGTSAAEESSPHEETSPNVINRANEVVAGTRTKFISPGGTSAASSSSKTATAGGSVTSGDSEADLEDFLQLPELRPPNIMPRGNVGTSTKEWNHSYLIIRICKEE